MKITFTPDELRAFETEVAKEMLSGRIHTPTHLSGGNEAQLIDIFSRIDEADWIFSNYRNHYHALLYGVPREMVMAEIMRGRSMTPHYPGFKFFTSCIVAGHVPAAVGVAEALKRKGSAEHVWCFIGDMASTTGIFHEASIFASSHNLPITFVIEDNGLSCDTPTSAVWGEGVWTGPMHYSYKRAQPHLGATH